MWKMVDAETDDLKITFIEACDEVVLNPWNIFELGPAATSIPPVMLKVPL